MGFSDVFALIPPLIKYIISRHLIYAGVKIVCNCENNTMVFSFHWINSFWSRNQKYLSVGTGAGGEAKKLEMPGAGTRDAARNFESRLHSPGKKTFEISWVFFLKRYSVSFTGVFVKSGLLWRTLKHCDKLQIRRWRSHSQLAMVLVRFYNGVWSQHWAK